MDFAQNNKENVIRRITFLQTTLFLCLALIAGRAIAIQMIGIYDKYMVQTELEFAVHNEELIPRIKDDLTLFKKDLQRLKSERGREIKYLQELKELTKDEKGKLDFLLAKQKALKNLISSDQKILDSVLSRYQDNSFSFQSFLSGIITSILGSIFYSYRRKMIQKSDSLVKSIKSIVLSYWNKIR